MKHEEDVIYRKYNPKTDFVQKDFYESVVPILTNTGKFPQNIIGTGFLMNYGKLSSYIVTAKHVLRNEENPIIMLTTKSGDPMPVGTKVLESFGMKWISNPDGKDISAIPLILPERFDREIRNRRIVLGSYIKPSNIKTGSQVKHIGYGGKMTGINKRTGKKIGLPGAAYGTYDFGTNEFIKVRSPALEGDSGSPLFLSRGKGISTIGVVIRTKSLKKIITQNKICGNTDAVPIHHVVKILNSEKMKLQVQKGLEKKESFDNMIKHI